MNNPNPKDETTTPVVNDGLPAGVMSAIAKEIKHTFGKGTVKCAHGSMRSAFNYTPGALICRNCGSLNVADAVACINCGMGYEITIYVGSVE